jgi:hypothetical protein
MIATAADSGHRQSEKPPKLSTATLSLDLSIITRSIEPIFCLHHRLQCLPQLTLPLSTVSLLLK